MVIGTAPRALRDPFGGSNEAKATGSDALTVWIAFTLMAIPVRMPQPRTPQVRPESLTGFKCQIWSTRRELIRYRSRDADHRGRRMYSPIAVRPIPTDRAITRSLAPQAYFRRRTSRTFRIDNLSAGFRPPLANRKGGPCPAQTADNAPRITPSTGWSLSIGLGGRFPSESVTALPRILEGSVRSRGRHARRALSLRATS